MAVVSRANPTAAVWQSNDTAVTGHQGVRRLTGLTVIPPDPRQTALLTLISGEISRRTSRIIG